MGSLGGGVIVNLTTAGHQDPSSDEAPGGLATPLAYPSSKAALDQLCRSVAPQLRAEYVAIINLHPGFVRTEMTELMTASGLYARRAIPIDIPARAIVHLVTCQDPFVYSGRVVIAEDLIAELGG